MKQKPGFLRNALEAWYWAFCPPALDCAPPKLVKLAADASRGCVSGCFWVEGYQGV